MNSASNEKALRKLTPISMGRVSIDDAFWSPRMRTNVERTIPYEFEKCRDTGRLDAFRLDWKPGMPNPPHKFWDSDVAKLLEAAAFALQTHPDEKLHKLVIDTAKLIASAQQPDGYLNVHFTVVRPEDRWKNLRDDHELYCAGHLMEAAVAVHRATGDRTLLDALSRYADLIDSLFGRAKCKKRGYPGHEEIELALVKLYRETGEKRYLDLSKYFIDERGAKPHFYDKEAEERGEDRNRQFFVSRYGEDFHYYNQSHNPVREQTEAVGHSVRAMYLYSGMADAAIETGDDSLVKPLKTLWRNVTEKRMYVIGSVGSEKDGERFTTDYDLPNDRAYTETCAAIGLVFWAHRMLQMDRDGRYGDAMERALYNGVMSGISLDGQRFFYVNPLMVIPEVVANRPELNKVKTERQEWFGCACCPPNIARQIASLGDYIYLAAPRELLVNLYVQGDVKTEVAGTEVRLRQKTRYPWDGAVELSVEPEKPSNFTLSLRLPGWCAEPTIDVNGENIDVDSISSKGFARIRRIWNPGDKVKLNMPMPVERVEAHPAVAADCGRVALQRGPVIYCLEEEDNGRGLTDIRLPREAKLTAKYDAKLLGGCVAIKGKALRRSKADWRNALYRPADSNLEKTEITAIPYSLWANRKPGEMTVWILEG